MTPTFSEKIPPSALESEQFVLGAMLSSPVGRLIALQSLVERDFWATKHAVVFSAIRDVDELGAVDVFQVSDRLKSLGKLNDIGGLAYLFACVNSCPTPEIPDAHVALVKEKSQRRRLITELRKGVDLLEDESRPFNEAQSTVESRVLSVREAVSDDVDPISWAESVDTESALVEVGLEGRRRVKTGYHHLDEYLRLYPKKLSVVAGRTSDGKTVLSLSVATKSALSLGQRTYYWSGEMDKPELWERMCASELGIRYENIQDRRLTPAERVRIKELAVTVKEAPLTIRDTAMTVADIRADCRYITHTEGPIDLVVIDYLLLLKDLNCEAEGNDRRDVRIGIMVWNLIQMARELDCHIILVHQMNRQVSGRATNRPMVSDLKESSAIEQHANNVVMVYRPERDDKLSEEDAATYNNLMEVIIGKQRGGRTGSVWMTFNGDRQQISTRQKPWPRTPEAPKAKGR